ncbi:dTDP-4-dehydrorhamnose 3,5-epimerase [Shewanella atlantica]|uniref:dTDP-4-dehydrorhamnose 3,5-epimerase n=1 Tax=Shewanella atlantica TaxID=271099 RepID=UPI0037358914
MNVIDTPISGLKIIEPTLFGDERGFFFESFRDAWFREHVSDVQFVQENQSRSRRGILRGLHYQSSQTQGKLVRVTCGEVFDVAVDLRRESPSYGQWFGTYLSEENKRQLWIPAGFAHGFYVLSETADCIYKCTDYYAPEFEKTILWNDTELSIDWPLNKSSDTDTVQPILSAKDRAGAPFNCREHWL